MKEIFTSGSVGGLVEQSPSLPGQATALVHEAYLPLADVERECCWLGRGSFGVGPKQLGASLLLA